MQFYLIWFTVVMSVTGVILRDIPCRATSLCTAAPSCPWYQDKIAQRIPYRKGSGSYNRITETIKKSICNQVEKKICCPRTTTATQRDKAPLAKQSGQSATCPSSVPCMDSSTCPWYKRNMDKRSQYRPSSPEYRNITQMLKASVCNKEHRHVCCKNIQMGDISPSWLPSSKKSECGIPDESGFIVGGDKTSLGAFPWVALLGRASRVRDNVDWHCGGTLINRWYVLTAAHCTTYNVTTVRLGEWKVVDTSKPDIINGIIYKRSQKRKCGRFCKFVDGDIDCIVENGGGSKRCGPPIQDISVDKIIRYPDYRFLWNSGIEINDIALIKLKTPVTFNSLVRPVCLPVDRCEAARSLKLRDCNLEDLEGSSGVAVGWGQTYTESDKQVTIVPSHIQHSVRLPFVSNEKCGQRYLEVSGWDISGDLGNQEHVCAGGEMGKDSCKGDSGGGLVMKSLGPQWLVGVVATGTRRCGIGLPAVFTRLDLYMDWIQQSIRH